MKRAKWITREVIEDREYGGPVNAKWVWAWEYCRIQAKKEFQAEEAVQSAEAYFICDNSFDFYLNGTEVTFQNNRADVTDLIVPGENIIAVRAYQTEKPERFLSALRGGITITYKSGKTDEIVTDASWKQLRLCNFGCGTEPENWQQLRVGEQAREERFEHLKEFEKHPSMLRRASVFSKKFVLEKEVQEAVLRGSAYGLWQPYINGKTGTYRLMPGTMEGRKEYQEFSVLELLQNGENEIRILLGNGWHNCECFGILDAKPLFVICELEITYKDGTTELIATDESWTAAKSRIYEDDLQYGERVDSRIDETKAGGRTVSADLETELVRQDYPLMGISEYLEPVEIKWDADRMIFDFGYNFSGRASFHFYQTRPGQKLTIRYYEFINKDGRYNLHTYSDVFYPSESDEGGKAAYAVKNLDFYIAKGAEYEAYEPVFTYTGLRYVIVYGLEEGQRCEAQGIVTSALLKDNAKLSSSCDYIEKLWDMAYKTWKGNVFSGPTDCPSREKNYWNGDMQLFANAACWCTDNHEFLARWTEYGRKIEYGVYGWEDEEYILPYVLYQFYGDTEVLKNKYDTILALMEQRGVFAGDVLPKQPHSPYNDHLTCGKNIDKQLFADAYYCLMLHVTFKIAEIIGKTADAELFASKYAASLQAFVGRYEENPLLLDNPAAIVLALQFHLFGGEKAETLAARLNKAVCENDYKLITGFHATRYILDILCDYGYADTAWKLVSQEAFPSWRYIAKTGSATFTEDWQGMATRETAMSMNHFTPGAFVSWFFEYLGGIRISKSEPGLSRIWLEPVMIAEAGDFAAEANTPYGILKTNWKKTDSGFTYTCAIPQGCTAELVLNGQKRELNGGKTYEIQI